MARCSSVSYSTKSSLHNEVVEVPALEFMVQYGKVKRYRESEWDPLLWVRRNPRHNTASRVAHIVALDTELGEVVYIKSLREEAISTESWGTRNFYEGTVSLWTSTDLELRPDLDIEVAAVSAIVQAEFVDQARRDETGSDVV